MEIKEAIELLKKKANECSGLTREIILALIKEIEETCNVK